MSKLRAPELIRCEFEEGFQHHLPATTPRWSPTATEAPDQTWHLLQGLSMVGPSPKRFGVTIQRKGADAYRVRMVWNRTSISWATVTRADLLGSDLATLLRALGTELWHLLDQPVTTESSSPRRAA